MSDEEYIQEGINMQLKPIKDKLSELEKKIKELEGMQETIVEEDPVLMNERIEKLERLIIHPNDGGTQLTLLEYQTTVYRNITELKDYYNIKKNVANETDFEWKVGIINRIIKSEEVLRELKQIQIDVIYDLKERKIINDFLYKHYLERIKKLDGEKKPTDTTANITQIIEIYDNGHEHVFYPDTHVLMEKADLEGYKKGLKEIRKKVKYMIKDGAREWFQETLAGLIQDVEKYLKKGDGDEQREG